MSLSTRLSFVTTALLFLVLSAVAAQAQTARCRPCEIALERCSVNCFGRENEIGACLIGCDNTAALCSCDEPATLSAEDYVERFGMKGASDFKAAACHPTTSCGPAYGACTNWSSYTACGDPTCSSFVVGCGACNELGQCEVTGPGMKQNLERYRVCLNGLGEPCTEYQRNANTVGCSC
jgi:hypothetical protein